MPKSTESTHPKRDAFPAGVSGPALRALDRAGIRRMADLSAWSENDLAALHGMGPKALAVLRVALGGTGKRRDAPRGDDRAVAAQLRSWISRLEPKTQKVFRAARAALRKRLPTANELAYDYGRALVIAYASSDRGIEAIVALRADAAGVSLYLSQAPRLADPSRILRGTGTRARFIPLDSASRLEDPEVEALVAGAIEQASVPLPSSGTGRLVIKSDGAKKTSRRATSRNPK